MSSGQSAARGALWSATNGAVSQLLSFAVFVVVARMLDPASYGLIALSMALILVLIAGSRLGLEKLLVQLESAGATETDTAFFLSAALCFPLALALWLASPLVADLVRTPELQQVMSALAPLVVLRTLEVVPLGLMVRHLRFKAIALCTILSLVAGGVAAIAMAVMGYGVWALVVQEIVRAVFSLAALWLACGWKPGLSVSAKAARRMLAAGGQIMGSEITRIAQNQADRFLIGSFLGAASLGSYTIASKVNVAAVAVLHDPLYRVGLPTFSRARSDPARLKFVYYLSQRLGAALTLPAFALLILTAQSVVPLLLGPQWQASIPVLQALCLAGCASSVSVFNGPLLLAVGRPDIVFRLSLFSAVTGFVACLVAIPWGILAVSLAFALRAWLMLPLELALCRHYGNIPTRPVWTSIAKQLLTLAPMALVVAGFQALSRSWQPWPALMTTLVLGGIAYALALIVTDRALARLLLRLPAMLLPRPR